MICDRVKFFLIQVIVLPVITVGGLRQRGGHWPGELMRGHSAFIGSSAPFLPLESSDGDIEGHVAQSNVELVCV